MVGRSGLGDVGRGWRDWERVEEEDGLESKAGTEGTHQRRQDEVPALWRSECSSSSGMGDLFPPHSMRNGSSPYDRVDGCPHKQQNLVGWAPGQLLQAVTPTRRPMMGEQPDQGGP